MALPATEDEILRFLQHRKDELSYLTDDTTPSWETFTFDNPHSCHYCANLVVDGCAYASSEGDDTTPFNLKTSLLEAIQLSNHGCPFFEWLVNTYADRHDRSRRLTVSYMDGHLQIGLPHFPQSYSWFATLELTSEGGGTAYIPEDLSRWRIFFCAKSDNLAAEYVSSRPHELDLESHLTVKFATDCLTECKTKHDICRMDTNKTLSEAEILDKTDLPTRLLEISSPNANNIRLVEVTKLPISTLDEIAKAGFVTLSYCWGGDQPVKLTKKTAQELHKGIAASSLPKTLQDAVKHTSALGMKYIWIDALCIPQDDDLEKGLEIARLPSYYRNNTATVVAASAESCTSGFLGRAKPQFLAGPFEIAMKTPKGMGSVLFYTTLEPPQPTTFRAWTLQESLLSRRLLIFGPDRLIWCCLAANSGCGGPDATMTTRIMGFPQSLVSNVYPVTVLETLPALQQWDMVILNYTRRRLTNSSDKLLAIAAAAEAIHATSRRREQQDSIYLAGLMTVVDSPDFVSNALGWLTADPTAASRIQTYTAPSWSWACIDGQIFSDPSYSGLGTWRAKWGIQHRFRLIHHEVALVLPQAPYGAVSSGFLKIKGPVWSLDYFKEVPLYINEGHVEDVEVSLECRLTLFPDTSTDKELIVMKDPPKLYLLELNLADSLSRFWTSGLLLCPVGDGETEFRRVGAYRYNTSAKGDDYMIVTDWVTFPLEEGREITLI
ncbi:hypothetical protein CEP54_002889 [Fusarium duplospermum]|uniref:Heterokaryon incompatibility domain-containing protein n=1 Tax=Fusarium duplospermum TaxID=1325734 RepID=A0A428QSU5_9HYPO|nr:hypothetical protein CEP54_002889 [Fusarium duplospermum]